jgi:hypothetical protein
LRHAAAWSGGVALGPLAVSLAACGDDAPAADPVPAGDAHGGAADTGASAPADGVVFALYSDAEATGAEAALREACKHLDFSWLGSGDSVLVKIACNSGNPHPAVTSPSAVRAMVAELFARGAGRVLVADQSGVESVRLAPGEQRFSSTRELTEENGLYSAIVASGADPHFFDDHGFEAGYFEATLPSDSHWKKGLYLPSIVREVDHIVYLPRMSSHAVAGYTHGLKSAMGWLRDDSRNHVHHDAASIYEKYTEINYTQEIRERFRLCLTLAEAFLLDFGPDDGTVAIADPRVVIASRSLAQHDALSASVLVHLDATLPKTFAGLSYSPALADTVNRFLLTSLVESSTGIPWGPDGAAGYTSVQPHAFEQGLSQNRPLLRAFALEGGWPEAIDVRLLGRPLDPALREHLETHGEGVLRFA